MTWFSFQLGRVVLGFKEFAEFAGPEVVVVIDPWCLATGS